jgi:exonuclease III
LQTYVPNSDAKNGDQIRKKWNENINKHINKLKLKNTPVIWTGDLNVSYLPTDSNYKSIAGTKQYEKQHIIDTINNGFVDVYKHFNLNTSVIKQRVIEKAYTLIIRNFKNKILKMRLDYFLVEKELLKHIENIYVDQTTTFSDHFPLIMKTNLSTI